MVVRILSQEGMKQFREYLGRVRSGETQAVPAGLLSDPSTSDPLAGNIEVALVNFTSKLHEEVRQYAFKLAEDIAAEPAAYDPPGLLPFRRGPSTYFVPGNLLT